MLRDKLTEKSRGFGFVTLVEEEAGKPRRARTPALADPRQGLDPTLTRQAPGRAATHTFEH